MIINIKNRNLIHLTNSFENEQYLQVFKQLKYKIHNMYVTNSYNM